MKKRLLGLILAMLAIPGAALAYGVQNDQNVTVSKGEVKTGTYYVSGQTVTVDGDINGDLICAGSTITVNGTVHGDVICAGQVLTINGTVDGSVRVAGQAITLGGSVGRNVTAMTQALTVSPAARVSGDLGVLAQTVNMNGPVERDVYGMMEYLTLASTVGQVDAHVSGLSLGSGAKVVGDLKYTSDKTFEVDRAKVGGDITRTAPAVSQAQHEENAARDGFARRLYWMLASLVVGLALVALVPRLVTKTTSTMRERPGASLGWGLLVTLLGPILAGFLMVTLVGIPLGLLAILAYILTLSISGVFVGIAVGQWLLGKADWRKNSLAWAAFIGLPLTVVVLSVPLLGGFLMLVGSCWAVGGLALSTRALRS